MSSVMTLKRYPSQGGMTFGKIGARRMMKSWSARDYVQDGLVAMWDGIENAGWGVHNPNATVWKDLVLGREISGSPNQNSFVLSARRSFSNIDMSADMTSEFLVSGSVSHDLLITITQNNSQRYLINGVNASYSVFQIRYMGENGQNTVYPLSKDGTESIAITYSSGKFRVYKNGVLVATYTDAVAASDNSIVNIGYANLGLRRTAFYSIALSADEIAANYAVDKLRFNLP